MSGGQISAARRPIHRLCVVTRLNAAPVDATSPKRFAADAVTSYGKNASLTSGTDTSSQASSTRGQASCTRSQASCTRQVHAPLRTWAITLRDTLQSPLGVLVIESPADSGSLITAREAGDQGRDVFAIPGPIGMGHNAGCHKLIQDGAKLVECVDDILSELGVLTMQSPDSSIGKTPVPILNLPPEQRRILDMLTLHPRQVEGMIHESRLSAPQVAGILTLLEMRGLARRVPGNAFVRVL